MHEAAITKSIVDTVLSTIAEKKVTGTIKSVYITAGICQSLIPESMQMYFDMEKSGTPLKNAELIVKTQGMVAYCKKCNTEHELDIPIMYCPDCGEPMKLIKGNEIILSSIEVEE